MAESKVSSVQEYDAKAQVQEYLAALEKLSHIISNPSDSASKDGAKQDGTGQIVSHLQELGEEIKKYFTHETQNNESWRNLGQTMELGLNLFNKLLEKNKPDPVQELGGNMSCMCSFSVFVNSKDKRALRRHEDEMDARMMNIRIPISKAFFQRHKGALETRLPNLRPILIKLVLKKVLNSTEREEVQSRSTSGEKNECLLMILDRKGPEAQEIFCQVLQRVDPFLVKDLDENC